MFISTSEHKRS